MPFTDRQSWTTTSSPTSHDKSRLPSAFVWADLDPSREDSLEAIEGLLASSYGGVYSGYLIQYESTFLRKQVFTGSDDSTPIVLGIQARNSGELVAFVAAVPTPAWYCGKPCTIALVNLWCARPDVRGTGIAHTLIQRLIFELRALELLEGVLFTGHRLHFPIISSCENWVRVLDASVLRDSDLLEQTEETPAAPEGLERIRMRELAENDTQRALALFDMTNSIYDVARRFDTPDQLLRFVGGRGGRSWILEDKTSGDMVAWFTIFTSLVFRAGGGAQMEPVRVANLWALGAKDKAAARDAIAAAIVAAAKSGHHLLESINSIPLSAENARTLAVRPGPSMNVHTYGSTERYRGLSINLPLF